MIELHSSVIRTERLLLREQTMDDLEFISAMLSHPEVMRHYPKLYSREEAQAGIERNLQQYADYGHGTWLAIERESGHPVGQVGLKMQEVEGELLPEIGYMIHRPYWRRGYAAEAALGVRAYAFERHDYPYVISLIRPQNIPSRMVARKLGMRPWRELIFKEIFHIAHRIDRAQLHTANG